MFKEHKHIILTAISGIFLVLSWFGWADGIIPFDPAWVSIIISGLPIVYGAAVALVTRFDIKAGLLVSIALIASVIIGEYFAAAEIAFIMMLGEILEDRTVRKANEGLKKLIKLSPDKGRVRTDKGEKEIDAKDIKVGDILLVKAGECIPVDGVIVNGKTTVNQAIMTGESMPVDKHEDDEVFIGTMNQLGTIEVKATKVGEDTSLSKLIKLVKDAESKKAPVVRFADKIANFIVPAALILAVVTFALTRDITRAVTILVVFCPCALVLATPTAIVAGIGRASQSGILIKSGEVLEKVTKIETIAFDKTGTITHGKPKVVDVVALKEGRDENNILKIAAEAEKFSEHPLGKAIVQKANQDKIDIKDPKEFKIELGKGVSSVVNDKNILVGNTKLLKENGINIGDKLNEMIDAHKHQGKTVMLVAEEQSVIGLINVADKVKTHAANTINNLKKTGIEDLLLITGDNEITAKAIGKKVGINSIFADQLPENKVEVIESKIENDKKVCMIGDGINDAPALARADIGIAMGALGADVAVETADIALMSDDISKIPELIMLSRKVLKTIKINITLSIIINIVAVILAGLGILDPIVGALVHNLGSLVVVMNSAVLIRKKLDIPDYEYEGERKVITN